MSERNAAGFVGICLLVFVLGGWLGSYPGREVGRDEMKRWQDSWYQAHPVVDYSQCPANMVKCSDSGPVIHPAPPKKAKPAKAECNSFGCKYPNLSRPAKATSAHEVLSPIFNMLDVKTTKHLTKFYVTIPYVEGHWEIMATDRVNAVLRLGSTSWTESEWSNCSTCQESKTVESIAVERWKNALPADCNVIGFYRISCDYHAQPIPEQELLLNCAPNFDCNKELPVDKP